jgi:GT2 family glycosyltransferase
MDDIQQDDKIAAVGCSILEPDKLTNKIMPIDYPAQTLANLWYNRQWMWDKELKQTEVEHLYSSFIYRTSAMDAVGGFAGGLSKVAFREETLTTYPMVLKGWKLHYNPAAIMWHMKSDRGGCRDFHIEELYKRDEAIFNERIKKMKEDNNA